MKKNKQGKWGVKMTPLKPGDLRFWGSDVFDRFEQQVHQLVEYASCQEWCGIPRLP